MPQSIITLEFFSWFRAKPCRTGRVLTCPAGTSVPHCVCLCTQHNIATQRQHDKDQGVKHKECIHTGSVHFD